MRKIAVLCMLVVLAVSCAPKPVPKDQQPLFGETDRTPEEKKLHDRLLREIIGKAGGSQEDAYRLLILAGWKEIEKGEFRSAIKRFNLAWLLQPMNPQVFYGFGSAFARMQDWESSFKWNQIAASAGYARAETNIGWMYLKGLFVEQDSVKAAEWYKKAAEQGEVIAQNTLGILYDFGIGVEMNEDEAAKWYDKADAQGYDGPWKKFRKKYFGKMFRPELVTFEDVLGINIDKDEPEQQPA